MSWQPEVDEIARRRVFAQAMGGAEAIAKLHAKGRLSVRERIDALLDPDSFVEIGVLTGQARYGEDGALVELTPANALIGTGRIDGRKVVVSADDFSIRGGSSEATISEKWIFAERLALEYRLTLIRLVDTDGVSVRFVD